MADNDSPLICFLFFIIIRGTILDFGITYSYTVLIMTSSVILGVIFGSVSFFMQSYYTGLILSGKLACL